MRILEANYTMGAVMQYRSTANRQAWLQRILLATLTVPKKTTLSEIIDAVKLHHQVPILAVQRNAPRTPRVMTLKTRQCNSVCCLHMCMLSVLQARRAHVCPSLEDREGTRRFQRLFICPGVSREAGRHCRPFTALDGTFTSGTFTVLFAASVGSSDHRLALLGNCGE